MKAFTMEVEYINAETGELRTEAIIIDDMEFQPAERLLPEADNNDDCPW